MTWQLGILTDSYGRVHLGAVLDDGAGDAPEYVDLLAPAGATSVGEVNVGEHLVVIVRGEQLAELRRLAEQCIDDGRLRDQLVQLTELSAGAAGSATWTA